MLATSDYFRILSEDSDNALVENDFPLLDNKSKLSKNDDSELPSVSMIPPFNKGSIKDCSVSWKIYIDTLRLMSLFPKRFWLRQSSSLT